MFSRVGSGGNRRRQTQYTLGDSQSPLGKRALFAFNRRNQKLKGGCDEEANNLSSGDSRSVGVGGDTRPSGAGRPRPASASGGAHRVGHAAADAGNAHAHAHALPDGRLPNSHGHAAADADVYALSHHRADRVADTDGDAHAWPYTDSLR